MKRATWRSVKSFFVYPGMSMWAARREEKRENEEEEKKKEKEKGKEKRFFLIFANRITQEKIRHDAFACVNRLISILSKQRDLMTESVDYSYRLYSFVNDNVMNTTKIMIMMNKRRRTIFSTITMYSMINEARDDEQEEKKKKNKYIQQWMRECNERSIDAAMIIICRHGHKQT
jgi:hypothetical protein